MAMRPRPILIAVLLLVLEACGNEAKELQRLSSPDGTVDAIVAIRETGATVATPTVVLVQSKGSRIHDEPIFLADHVEGLVITWSGGGELVIRADTARVFLEPKGDKVDVYGIPGRSIAVKLEIGKRR